MKTVKTSRIEAELDGVEFGFWEQYSEEEGEFHALRTRDDYRKAAEYLGCTEELLDTLASLHDSFLDALSVDLKEIWERMDRIEDVLVKSV